MCRTIIIVIELIFALALFIPYGIIALIVRLIDKRAAGRMMQAFCRIEARIIIWLTGSNVEVYGVENVPRDRASLFISNHRSLLDIVFAYAYTPVELAFVAKKELEGIPVLTQIVVLMNGIFLDRDNIRQGLETILKAIDEIQQGISIWICPEGTRQKKGRPDEMLEFHAGSFKIATKSGAPIVPVTMTGTREILEDQLPLFKVKKSHVVMRYMDPVYTDELDAETRKHVGEYVRNLMIETIRKDIDSDSAES